MTIDLTNINTKTGFHLLMKSQLGFPEWYGINWVSWDAFWDAIIAVVEMPDEVILLNWQEFAQACPKDMQILRQIILDYQVEKPTKRLQLAAE